ncbi:MAG: lysophospholipid acyltransferase family protein [Alphaproteobacteria bacterium]
MNDLTSPVMAVIRLAGYLGWTLLLLPVQMVAVVTWRRLSFSIPQLYHRGALWVLGLKIERKGVPVLSRPVLFVSNHASYLDIHVLGALLNGSFIAKQEVASWPLLGLCAKLQRSVFVDRRPGTSADQRDAVAGRLAKGESLILFPEGTSSDGNRVLPFKSALLSVAEPSVGGRPLTVQPISLAYARHSNMPMGRALRPFYAWYGDMGFADHLWRVLGLGPAVVAVRFHAPVTIDDFGGRKELARHCERVVSQGVIEALYGVAPPPSRAAA